MQGGWLGASPSRQSAVAEDNSLPHSRGHLGAPLSTGTWVPSPTANACGRGSPDHLSAPPAAPSKPLDSISAVGLRATAFLNMGCPSPGFGEGSLLSVFLRRCEGTSPTHNSKSLVGGSRCSVGSPQRVPPVRTPVAVTTQPLVHLFL